MGYEFFVEKIIFLSAPVPGINNDQSLNGFLCLLIVFLKSKTYQLILKDVIKLNRNLW